MDLLPMIQGGRRSGLLCFLFLNKGIRALTQAGDLRGRANPRPKRKHF